jgi:hypothetical protein
MNRFHDPILILLLLVFAAISRAQVNGTAITGTVTDP